MFLFDDLPKLKISGSYDVLHQRRKLKYHHIKPRNRVRKCYAPGTTSSGAPASGRGGKPYRRRQAPSSLPRRRQSPRPSDASPALVAAGMFWCRLARRRLVSAFDSSPCRPGTTLVEGLDLSKLRSIARLAPDSRSDLVSRPATRPTSSHALQHDRARLAPGAARRVDGG